jgi:hypothetical protein
MQKQLVPHSAIHFLAEPCYHSFLTHFVSTYRVPRCNQRLQNLPPLLHN